MPGSVSSPRAPRESRSKSWPPLLALNRSGVPAVGVLEALAAPPSCFMALRRTCAATSSITTPWRPCAEMSPAAALRRPRGARSSAATLTVLSRCSGPSSPRRVRPPPPGNAANGRSPAALPFPVSPLGSAADVWSPGALPSASAPPGNAVKGGFPEALTLPFDCEGAAMSSRVWLKADGEPGAVELAPPEYIRELKK